MNLVALFFVALIVGSSANRCRQNAAVYNFAIGNIRGTVLSDGPITFLAPDVDVKRSYEACFLPTVPFSLGLNVVVLDTPAGRLLVDPGSQGSQNVPFLATAGLLFQNLRAAGIRRSSIDAVLLTHAHADHVTGLLTADGARAFPRATVYISRRENDFWTKNPLDIPDNHPLRDTLALFGASYRESIEPYSRKLVLVNENGTPLPNIRFISTPGLSPGHSAIEVTTGAQRLIISGDTWFSKPDQVQNPEWPIGTDTDNIAAIESRLRLLTSAAKGRDLVLAYHEQFPGLGYVSRRADSFDWVPAPPQNIGAGVRQICPDFRRH